MFSLTLHLAPCSYVFQSYFFLFLAWGRLSWSMCFPCICMFILHTLLFCLFVFLLLIELAADFDCDTPWTFRFPFWFSFFVWNLRSTELPTYAVLAQVTWWNMGFVCGISLPSVKSAFISFFCVASYNRCMRVRVHSVRRRGREPGYVNGNPFWHPKSDKDVFKNNRNNILP